MRSGGFTGSYSYAIRKIISFCISSHSFTKQPEEPAGMLPRIKRQLENMAPLHHSKRHHHFHLGNKFHTHPLRS